MLLSFYHHRFLKNLNLAKRETKIREVLEEFKKQNFKKRIIYYINIIFGCINMNKIETLTALMFFRMS